MFVGLDPMLVQYQQNLGYDFGISGGGKSLRSNSDAKEQEAACFVVGCSDLEQSCESTTEDWSYFGGIVRERLQRNDFAFWNKTKNGFIVRGHLKADRITITDCVANQWRAILGHARLKLIPISRIKHGVRLLGVQTTSKADSITLIAKIYGLKIGAKIHGLARNRIGMIEACIDLP